MEKHCILGLPFHAVGLQASAEWVVQAIRERRRVIVSTPNLNYLVACHRDPAFHRTVIDSDLVLADGMPIVWLSKLLGTPLPERVAGSDLFDTLRRGLPGQPRLKVFFFGGPPGAAEAACNNINANAPGMHCVGWDSPGYGPVSELSDPQALDRINRSGADLLVVSLGAVKGQAWIHANRPRMEAPVMVHLGAVVNFVAGTVRRAPAWMRRAGLEWMWRIKEEPTLWRRYVKDAWALVRILAKQPRRKIPDTFR